MKGWAFKIQFQGRRRTFSLAGRTRADAAQEAQQLHAAIVSQGWEATTRLYLSRRQKGGGTTAPAGSAQFLKAELAYWEQRLTWRGYREARLAPDPEYSVRIEHDGVYSYFPLGSSDPRLAAAKAREIHSAVLATGWRSAFEQFEREITLAVFWSDNPAAATYTTLFTFPRESPPRRPPAVAGDHARKPLVVVEADPTIHGCLRYWLDRQPGFACAAVCCSTDEALEALVDTDAAMVLFNRVAPDMSQLAERVRARHALPRLFAFAGLRSVARSGAERRRRESEPIHLDPGRALSCHRSWLPRVLAD